MGYKNINDLAHALLNISNDIKPYTSCMNP